MGQVQEQAAEDKSVEVMLRAFRPSDLEAAFQLDQQCFPPGIAYSLEELRQFVTAGSAFAIVAERTGEPAAIIAGFLVARQSRWRRSKSAQIVTIDVAADARRNGVATQLMDAAETHYAQAGCASIALEVAVNNPGAQQFYRQRGYSPIGLRRGYYGGVLDAWSMSKALI
jgi:ribosomal protein S18 acetylase RimI-like enzyme